MESLIKGAFISRDIRGIYGVRKWLFRDPKPGGKANSWEATLIEPKMNINLYKGYTTGFLLKKTEFSGMTEVKF